MADDAQALIHDLDSMDHETRTRAHHRLVALGSQAVEPLIDTIRRAEGRKCWLSVHALAEIPDERVVPALIDLLDSQHVIVRQTVAEVLGKIGDPRAVVPLIDALQSTFSSTIRHIIIRALENIGDLRALPHIVPFLEDEDPHVRSRSEKAIRTLSAR